MRTSFNAGWIVKPKLNRFLELTGATSGTEPETVTLPHDAMIGTTRDPSGSHMNAYFPDGVWEYTKTFDVPEEWRDRRVRLQFEGVYRDAQVFVNDDFAGGEPYGYGEFLIDLDPCLRYGATNTIKVECRAGDDSRWYSGAGIYRDRCTCGCRSARTWRSTACGSRPPRSTTGVRSSRSPPRSRTRRRTR